MGKLTPLFAGLSRDVAIHLLGKPPYTTTSELRWGNKNGLVMNIAGGRQGRFYDFSTGERGDLIDLVMREQGCSHVSAIHWLQQFGGAHPGANTHERDSSGSSANPKLRWSSKAQFIWDSSVPLAGTLGEAYLRARCCAVLDVCDLRFLPSRGSHAPAIVARVTDFSTGQPMTLHFIRLDPSTCRKIEGPMHNSNLKDHAEAGGVVRLVRWIEVGGTLGLAEGIETALSVIAGGRGPVWATLGNVNMASLPTTDVFGGLNIWADNDPPGMEAASKLADRWCRDGHPVRIMAPPIEGQDWNDVVRELRP